MNAANIMILTTRGRKSGQSRPVAVEYRTHGSKIFVVSGWGTRPQWFQNVLTHPKVTLQLGSERIAAEAAVIDQPGEAQRALTLFRRRAPLIYDAVLARMSQQPKIDAKTLPDVSDQFTIVRFNRLPDAPPLPPVRADLAWVLPLSLVLSAVTLALLAVMTRTRR